MKFDFKLDRKTLIKIACLILLLAVMPFSMELILLADIGGLDFALTFFMLYLSAMHNAVLEKWADFKKGCAEFIVFASQLYMFKPKIFVPHIAASGIVLAVTCSMVLACLFWVPLMYVSSGFIT